MFFRKFQGVNLGSHRPEILGLLDPSPVIGVYWMSVKTTVILRLNLFCIVIYFYKYRIASYRLNSANVVIWTMWNGFQSSFLKTHFKSNFGPFFFVSGRLRDSF